MNPQPDSDQAFRSFQRQSRPVFLFGNNRAGTTMLHNLAGLHPDTFKLARNTYFLEQFWRYRKLLPHKMLHKLFVATQLREGFPPAGREELFHELCGRLMPLLKRLQAPELFAFFAFAEHCLKSQSEQPPNIWLEKTNSHAFYYRKLKAWFPQAKFVCIVRDPRANAASAYRVDQDRGLSTSANRAIMSAAVTWVQYNASIKALIRDFPADSLLLKYEELVAAPLEETVKLFEFLDLCPQDEKKLAAGIEGLDNVKASNIGVQRSGGIDTQSTERWRELLNAYQLDVVTQITGALARDFGYVLDAPSGGYGKLPDDSWGVYTRRRLWQLLDGTGLWKVLRPLLHWK